MNYAVDYAPVGGSEVYAWQGSEQPRRIELAGGKGAKQTGIFSIGAAKARKSKLAANMSTNSFLEQLQADDIVFTELGGQNDRFCLAAAKRGIKLLRLPTWIISDEQKRQRHEEGKVGAKIDSAASILCQHALSNPELFYPFRELEDERYLRVRLLTRMYWTVQRKIRIATANRLRHLQQDLEYFGGIGNLPVIQEAIESVLETLPAEEQVEAELDPKTGMAVKFYKSLESKLKTALEVQLEELPLYQAVFAPLRKSGCAAGIAGYLISSIMDIRRFPTFQKLKAFAGYHLVRSNGNWVAPKPTKGQRANWDHVFQQGVWYFTFQVNTNPPNDPWKQHLEWRYGREIEKLLGQRKQEGKVPADMTLGSFTTFVEQTRAEQMARGIKEPTLPEPYKGIPVIARKRALRWLGQKFLQYIWNEWRRFEGLMDEQRAMSA